MAWTHSLFNVVSKTISVSVTSAASTSAALPGLGDAVRIVNEGPNVAFVAIGVGSQTATVPSSTATATCTAIAVGDTVLSIPNQDNVQISAICRTSQTATLSIQVGAGV